MSLKPVKIKKKLSQNSFEERQLKPEEFTIVIGRHDQHLSEEITCFVGGCLTFRIE